MQIIDTEIGGVYIVEPKRFEDTRGWFRETYNAAVGDALGGVSFVQDNESLSRAPGTVRGLHLQRAPFAQGKLVRVLRGAVWDVAVDVRPDSPSYARHVGRRLDEGGAMLWIPTGFAHGFITLEPDTVVGYKVTAPYHAESEASIRFDDAAIAIDWGRPTAEITLSDRDASAGSLADLGGI